MSTHAGTAYEPADHSLTARQTLAGWAIFAALLVMALAADVGHTDSHAEPSSRPLVCRWGLWPDPIIPESVTEACGYGCRRSPA
ncbi:MAG TPA: hypothetical protein VMQ73_07110 [Methylomirabilota bacterium]|nr:hypothetical protein [Methylomirabilota bacterium]